MDSNNKNNFRVDPLPPSYLSVALMYCFGVHANSVRVSSVGNVNDRLNRELESCAWLVVWLAGIHYRLANVARRMGLLVLMTCWQLKYFLTASAKHD